MTPSRPDPRAVARRRALDIIDVAGRAGSAGAAEQAVRGRLDMSSREVLAEQLEAVVVELLHGLLDHRERVELLYRLGSRRLGLDLERRRSARAAVPALPPRRPGRPMGPAGGGPDAS